MEPNKSESDIEPLTAPVKAPEFSPDDPALFIHILETQFRTYRVTSQHTRYCKLLSALPLATQQQLRDVIMAPQGTNPYDDLRDALLQRTAVSEEKRLQHLLSGIQLNSLKPSQLLIQMRCLVSETPMPESLMRQLWLQRLPTSIRGSLAMFPKTAPLMDLADAADRALEAQVPTYSHVSPIHVPHQETPTRYDELCARMEQLMQIHEQTAAHIDKISTRNPSLGRSQPPTQVSYKPFQSSRPSSSNSSDGICYYHRRFKEKARKCTPPCNFLKLQGNGNAGR